MQEAADTAERLIEALAVPLRAAHKELIASVQHRDLGVSRAAGGADD